MKIWIFNQYNMPPNYGHLNRHYYLGKYFKELGHEPYIFVGSFLHNLNIQLIKDKKKYVKSNTIDFNYYFIKTNSYKNSKIKRIIGMIEYYHNLLKVVKKIEKPDIIIGSSSHPLACLAAIKLGKKYHVPSIIEIRDLWPESFVQYGIIKKNNIMLPLLYLGEKWIYKKANKIIFTMEGGVDYILKKQWDIEHGGPIDIKKVYHINNGVDLKSFKIAVNEFVYNDEEIDNKVSFKVVYTGSIRRVNKIDLIVKAAECLMDINEIIFIIFGDGDYKEELVEYVKNKNMQNIFFKGHIDKKYIPSILSKSDINIISGESNELFEYGISPNKLFDYFASQKPILQTFSVNYSLINKYKAGIEVIDSNEFNIAETIKKFYLMNEEIYLQYAEGSKKASEDYCYSNLSQKYLKILSEE